MTQNAQRLKSQGSQRSRLELLILFEISQTLSKKNYPQIHHNAPKLLLLQSMWNLDVVEITPPPVYVDVISFLPIFHNGPKNIEIEVCIQIKKFAILCCVRCIFFSASFSISKSLNNV